MSTTQSPHPASLLRRLAAMLYDSLIVLSLWMLATFLVLPFAKDDAFSAGNPFYTAYLLAITFCFFVWFWMHGGQTIGMKAWRLRVQSETAATALSFRQAALRFFIALPSLLLGGLGFFYLLTDKRKRALYDKVARTIVIVLPKK